MLKRLLIVTLLATFSLAAQTSSIKGEVTDGQGASIPDAVITLTNRDTSAVRKTTSDAAGSYSMPSLAPGNYKLEAVRPGFRAFVAQITLQIDTPAALDIRMELGQVTEVVNVEATASSVNVENAAVGAHAEAVAGLALERREGEAARHALSAARGSLGRRRLRRGKPGCGDRARNRRAF